MEKTGGGTTKDGGMKVTEGAEGGKKKRGRARFLTFLLYGGWMLIAVAVIAIVIAAQSCGA